MLPSIWANLMTSASCVVTARITICCWPLRVVSAPAPGDACALPLLFEVGGGSSVPSTWTPWTSVLTVVELYGSTSGANPPRGAGVALPPPAPGRIVGDTTSGTLSVPVMP